MKAFVTLRGFTRKRKKYDLAEKEYKAATVDFPEKINARFSLGYFYQNQKRFDAAFEVFEQIDRRQF